MRLDNEGLTLWYCTSDAPGPEGVVPAETELPVTAVLSPRDASNQLDVQYRVNSGAINHISAEWSRNDESADAQYFTARLPAFSAGDEVDWWITARCSGRHVPAPSRAGIELVSLRVDSSIAGAPGDNNASRIAEFDGPTAPITSAIAIPPTRASAKAADRISSYVQRRLRGGTLIIFHHSMSYAGTAGESTEVNTTLKAPTLKYTEPENGRVSRQFSDDMASVSFTQPTNQTSYRAPLPETFLTGDTDVAVASAAQFFTAALVAGDLEALTVPVSVDYRLPDGQVLGGQQFDVLILPKLIIDPDRGLSTHVEPPRGKGYFVVNRTRFLELRNTLAPLGNDALVLVAISYLTQLVDDVPTFADSVADTVAKLLASLQSSPEAAAQIVSIVRNAHESIVDVPLTVPELKKLVIAGTLNIVAPEGTTITGKHFATYEISAEWTDGGNDLPHVWRFRFADQVKVTNSQANFTLTQGKPVYRSSLLDGVRIAVRGLDGSSLWSQNFEPDDPTLKDLQISVPLQTPTTLTGPVSTPLDANLRLRGRILLLSKNCGLKDLLVLVQARTTADGPWRVVGAANADNAGNFGMPYPYGTYVQAQAICSIAPYEPADIPIVAAAGNQTISTDFLYLLVRNPYSPDQSCGDENCGCGTLDNPGRLPDFADLIGSDAYSQDIGGSCINLSKPNRTINEFTFQAIVRTSDPEVASYRLGRQEIGLDAIDVSQLAAVVAAGDALQAVATRVLAAARQSAEDQPNVGTSRVLKAVEAAYPYVLAVEVTLADGGMPITISVLAATQNQLDAVISTLQSAREQLANEDFNFPADVIQLIESGQALKALVAQSIDAVGTSVSYKLTSDTTTFERPLVGLNTPIGWQNAPEPPRPEFTFAQAVSVATGHILHYKAQFKADGYSLGDLAYALPLAPGQKKEIVIFDASQTLVGAESQQLTQNERLAMGLVDERDITSRLAGSLSESLRGRSSANTSGISAGFGTGGQGYGSSGAYGGSGSAVIGVAGGVAQASSNANQDSSRDVAQFFGEKLRQSIMQNAEGYRQLNASVVTTVQQGQRYGVTSEVIANHNHCHSLTMMYFEVLRHYAIFQELASVEECVFVPLLLARFSVDNIAAWRDLLAPALLQMPSETYLQPFLDMAGSGRQHPLIKAFDAVQRLRSHYANVDFPAGSYDEEPIRFAKGSMQLRVSLPRPKTRYDRIKSLPMITKTVTTDEIDLSATIKSSASDAIITGLTMGLYKLFNPSGPNIQYKTAQVEAKKAIFDAFMSMDANFENVPPAQCMRVTNFNPGSITANGITIPVPGLDFFKDGDRDRDQWKLYAKLLGYTDVLAMLTYYFQGRLISEWDDIFYNDIVPLVFDKIIDSLRLSEFATDFTPSRRYTGGEQLIIVTVSGTTNKRRDQLPEQLKLSVASADAQALRTYVTMNVEDVRMDYSTTHYHGPLYAGSVGDDLLDGVSLDIPERPDEKRNPRREDRYLAGALIEHLNTNLEYYNKVLWAGLDADRRYMLLDGFSVQVYNANGTPVQGQAGLRSLASVVKNEVLTVAGNSLVLPVAPGYRVNGSFVQATTGSATAPVSLFQHYEPLTPVEPYRISVPTRGVFAEAVQGACNACEKIETDRLQDWTRFGIDEPTAIAPVTLPTPTPEEWKAAFREFANPIVNVQNAPGTPAPGAGMAGLSELLSASGVFKDITGLDANQQNVLKTYLSNQENAKAFAEMAKEMAMQSHNTQNSGKIVDSITAAKNSGAISQGDAGQLVKDHLQQQIDGGASKKAKTEADGQASATPLSQAAVTAASEGKDVTASRLDSAGNSESVTIHGPQSSEPLAHVTGFVPKIRQDNEKHNDCWAVAAAIMIGWDSKQLNITPADAVATAGRAYLEMYEQDTGLFAKDQDDFILHCEMISEAPASYPLQQYIDWMKTYGPLWVTIDAGPDDAFSPHALVLTRIAGTGTPDGVGTYITYINPADGVEVTQSFAEFVRAYEQLAFEDRASNLRPQVIHFIAGVDVPTGYHIQFKSGGLIRIHEPIHESVTLAALTASTIPVPPGTTIGNSPYVNEFFRGVIWNDDPAVLLFKDLGSSNWRFTKGLAWLYAYETSKRATSRNPKNLTGRSHYFDLSFLHAMAAVEKEEPHDTLAKILLWAEVMYRLSIGEGISGTDLLASIPVVSTVTAPDGTAYSHRLSEFFDSTTRPPGTASLDDLLTRRTRFLLVDLRRRAVGSLLHLVHDSYAKGHVRRTLLNPNDLKPGSTDQFKPGTWGRYGEVENFHCYRGQNEEEHSKYDTASGVDAAKLETFNPLIGARDAVEASRKVLDMWHAGKAWAAAGGPKAYLEGTVFKLAAKPTPADPTV